MKLGQGELEVFLQINWKKYGASKTKIIGFTGFYYYLT